MRKILVLMVASMSMAAFAQQEKKPVQPPTKEIIFDGDLIEGDTDQPDIEYLRHGSPVFRPSLIKVRTEFKDKVLESAREL
jgi:hypothetical protein